MNPSLSRIDRQATKSGAAKTSYPRSSSRNERAGSEMLRTIRFIIPFYLLRS